MGVNKVHTVQLLKKRKKERLMQVYTWWFKPGRKYGRKKKKKHKKLTAAISMFRLFITHIKAVMLSCILFLMFGDEKRRLP